MCCGDVTIKVFWFDIMYTQPLTLLCLCKETLSVNSIHHVKCYFLFFKQYIPSRHHAYIRETIIHVFHLALEFQVRIVLILYVLWDIGKKVHKVVWYSCSLDVVTSCRMFNKINDSLQCIIYKQKCYGFSQPLYANLRDKLFKPG